VSPGRSGVHANSQHRTSSRADFRTPWPAKSVLTALCPCFGTISNVLFENGECELFPVGGECEGDGMEIAALNQRPKERRSLTAMLWGKYWRAWQRKLADRTVAHESGEGRNPALWIRHVSFPIWDSLGEPQTRGIGSNRDTSQTNSPTEERERPGKGQGGHGQLGATAPNAQPRRTGGTAPPPCISLLEAISSQGLGKHGHTTWG
jgi:hypothetical protein